MKRRQHKVIAHIAALGAAATLLSACSTQSLPGLPPSSVIASQTASVEQYQYLIGPDDTLQIFVWGNPEVSGNFTVRPDGQLSTSLVDDLQAAGRTPTELARSLEDALSIYIKDPIVSVIVEGFVGPYQEQVRIIGEASEPKAIHYRQNMTLLDAMIEVNGLTEFADGDAARLIRVVDGEQREYGIQIDRLVRDGNISANVDILPGDIIIIPEAWF